MNRQTFYEAVQAKPSGSSLTETQVAGMNDLLDVWDRSGFTDLMWLAYILGGVFHEVGRRMVPVREGFASTDAGARAAVAKLHKAGRISRNYAAPNAAGVSFYGRGRIQNTFEANYRKLEKRFGHPFTTNPDLLLESKIDAEVTIYGHAEGIWTGKKLGDYFNANKADWKQARRIVNGLDKADLIVGYAKAFHAALLRADDGTVQAVRPPPDIPAPEPPVAAPQRPVNGVLDDHSEDDPVVAKPAPANQQGGWAGILAAIVKALFGR